MVFDVLTLIDLENLCADFYPDAYGFESLFLLPFDGFFEVFLF